MEPSPALYGQQNNSQKIRFIIITAVVAVVVLGIAVWAIVAMVSGKNRNTTKVTEPDTVATQDQTDKQTESTEKQSEDITSTTEGVSTTVPAQTQTNNQASSTQTQPSTINSTAAAKSNNLPSTGPADFLPIALLLGSLTTCLASAKLAREVA